jgi:choline dehydrogenase-like flavoprotein
MAKFSKNDDSLVVIIGSGAGGGVLGMELAMKGIKTVVLEAGGRHGPQDFVNDEWASFGQISWLDQRTTSGDWRVSRDFSGLPSWIVKAVGGSTLHWAGASLRFQPHEWKVKTNYGNIKNTSIMDWPIDHKEMDKWYTRAENHIPKGEATGNLECRTNAQVIKIEHDKSGKVTGVVYADAKGKQQRQKARVVCVAGNSIESPRLLLNSESSMFKNGLANSSGEVGKNYMRHMTASTYAIFENPVYFYRGTTMAGIVTDESINDPKRGFVGGYELETLALGLPFMAAFLDPGQWGRGFASSMERYDHMAGLWIVGEDMPQSTNAVSLHKKLKDQHGMPIPNVNFSDHENDIKMRNHAWKQSTALYKSVGATKVLQTPPYPSTHNLGTNRMSASAKDGVCNRNGQTWDIKNLFISDGSQFTTGAAENPTLTIVALAMRQAEFIAKQMSSKAI